MAANQPTSDAGLIRETLAGDRDAFRRLVERYQDYVFSIVLPVTRSREEAEEVAQDVFLKVFRTLPTFGEKAKFSTWLYTIAYRTAIDKVWRKRLPKVALDDDENALQVEDNNRRSPEYNLRQKDLSEQLRVAIRSLKPKDAALITLFYLHER